MPEKLVHATVTVFLRPRVLGVNDGITLVRAVENVRAVCGKLASVVEVIHLSRRCLVIYGLCTLGIIHPRNIIDYLNRICWITRLIKQNYT